MLRHQQLESSACFCDQITIRRFVGLSTSKCDKLKGSKFKGKSYDTVNIVVEILIPWNTPFRTYVSYDTRKGKHSIAAFNDATRTRHQPGIKSVDPRNKERHERTEHMQQFTHLDRGYMCQRPRTENLWAFNKQRIPSSI